MSSKAVKNYANTLFEAVGDRSMRELLLQELSVMQQAIDGDKKVQEFLYSDVVAKEEKIAFVERVFKSTALHNISLNFIKLLAKNHRIDYLARIHAELKQRIERNNQERFAVVKYARGLSKSDQKEVVVFLEEKYGYKFSLRSEQDKSLIGGIIISFDDVVIDASVKGLMENLEDQLDDAYLQSIN